MIGRALALFLVWVALCPALASAVPAISAVTGPVTDGQSFTVSGSGFESKSTAGPALFDSFDSAPATIASTSGGSTPEIRNFPFASYTWEYGGGGAYTCLLYTSRCV